jgi:hypothetical protein
LEEITFVLPAAVLAVSMPQAFESMSPQLAKSSLMRKRQQRKGVVAPIQQGSLSKAEPIMLDIHNFFRH